MEPWMASIDAIRSLLVANFLNLFNFNLTTHNVITAVFTVNPCY